MHACSYRRNEFVDFTIVNELGDELKAHMEILSMSCVPIKETIDSGSRRFLLTDVSADAMEQLLNYMYTREIEIDEENVFVRFSLLYLSILKILNGLTFNN